MELWEEVINRFPELTQESDLMSLGITLRDDSDALGAYIAKWDYSKPIPEGLKLGK